MDKPHELDKEIHKHLREGRQLIIDAMREARGGKIDPSQAAIMLKGSAELVKVGKLELDIATFLK